MGFQNEQRQWRDSIDITLAWQYGHGNGMPADMAWLARACHRSCVAAAIQIKNISGFSGLAKILVYRSDPVWTQMPWVKAYLLLRTVIFKPQYLFILYMGIKKRWNDWKYQQRCIHHKNVLVRIADYPRMVTYKTMAKLLSFLSLVTKECPRIPSYTIGNLYCKPSALKKKNLLDMSIWLVNCYSRTITVTWWMHVA